MHLISWLSSSLTRFQGTCEVVHTSFSPYKNDNAFLWRSLTPYLDVEQEGSDDEEQVLSVASGAQQMPPPQQPQQFQVPPPRYFDPFFSNMQQEIQAATAPQFQEIRNYMDGQFRDTHSRFDIDDEMLNDVVICIQNLQKYFRRMYINHS